MTTKQQPVSGGDPYSGNAAGNIHGLCHSAAQRATYERPVRALRESGIVPVSRFQNRLKDLPCMTTKQQPVSGGDPYSGNAAAKYTACATP